VKNQHQRLRDLLVENGLTREAGWPEELSEHLAACASCRALAEELRAVAGRLRSLPEVALPERLTAQSLRRGLVAEWVRWIDPEYAVCLPERRGLQEAPLGTALYQSSAPSRAPLRRLPAPL